MIHGMNEIQDTLFGAVIFDDPDLAEGGWMSIDGGPAVRIASQTALPTDTIFWSNLTFNAFFEARGKIIPNIRGADYLPVKLKDMLKEWSADPAMIRPGDYVVMMSNVFRRVMGMAGGISAELESPAPLFVNDKLAQDLRVVLPEAEFPRDDDELNSVLRAGVGFSYTSLTTVRSRRDGVTMSVARPRLDHAIDILSSPVPNGPFIYRRGSTVPPARELARSSRPVMAEIRLHGVDPAIGSIYGFGLSPKRGAKVTRTWVAQPELAAMANWADIEVRGAIIGSNYGVLSQSILASLRKFLLSKQSSVSWSAGVLATTIWTAAAAGKPMTSRVANRDLVPQTSYRGAWLRGVDKVLTFGRAMAMHRAGFAVLSYNGGQVTCSVPPDRRDEFILAAWECGMTPSIFDVPRAFTEAGLASVAWGGDPNSRPMASLILQRKANVMWELDSMPLASEQERAEIVERIRGLTVAR